MRIDLNADLGEGYGVWALGDDDALLDVVTSANVACGFHAGDPATMLRTVVAAHERGVRIGAQVSYPDLVGFGRRRMDVDTETLAADVLYQLGALQAICRSIGAEVSYLKPHGALYNRIVGDEQQARAVVNAMTRSPEQIPLMVLPGSTAAQVATELGVPTIAEGYADRAYTGTGALVPRSEPGAVLHDPDVVAARVVRLVTEQRVTAVDGSELDVSVDSVCLHGDTPGAVAIARAVHAALTAARVEITA